MTSVLTPLTPLGSMHHSDTNTKAKNFVLVQRYQDMLKSLNDESDCSDLLMGPTPDQEVPVSYFCNDKIKTEVVEEEEAEIVPDTPTILGDLSNFGYIPSDTILHPGNDGNNGYNKPVNPFLNSYNNINNNSNNNNNPNSIPAYNNNNNRNNGHNNIPTPVYKACHDDNMPTTAINKQTIDFSSSRKPQDCFPFKQTTVTPNNSKSLQNYSQQSTSPCPKQQQQQQQQSHHHHQLQSIQNSCISSSTLLLSSSLPSSTQSQFWSSMPSSSSLSSTTSLSSSLSPPASSPSFQRQIAPQNNIFSTSPIPSSSSPMLINNSGSPAPSPYYSSSSSLSLSSSSSPLLSPTSFTSTPPRSEQPTKVRSFVSELNGSGCTVLSGALPNFLNGSCFSTGNARAETDLLSSTRNQDDSIEYTDLDKVSEVSFYDDLTSVANKDDENRFPIEEMVEMMRSEIDRDRRELNLPHDPEYWSPQEVTRWVKWVCRKHNVPDISHQLESFSGAILCSRTSQSLMSLSPTSGLNVYQELELWKQELELWKTAQFSFGSSPQGFGSPSTSPVPSHMSSNHSNMDSQQFFHSSMDSSEDDVFFSENEVSSMKPQIAKASSSDSFKNINLQKFKNGPFKPRLGRGHKKAITLWQFLLELLVGEEDHSDCIKWLNKESRIFKIEDSKKVASLWGKVKSRPAMNYDKLSRSVRQYYRKGIIKKPEQTKRLVYQFCPGIC